MSARTLLIVEDDPHTRRVIRKLMEARGWAVAEAEGVGDGLARLDAPPDCVVLDLLMPGGPGEALLAAIRGRGLPTRVVVLSGVAEDHRIARAAELGADRVLFKPVAAEALYQACEGGPHGLAPGGAPHLATRGCISSAQG